MKGLSPEQNVQLLIVFGLTVFTIFVFIIFLFLSKKGSRGGDEWEEHLFDSRKLTEKTEPPPQEPRWYREMKSKLREGRNLLDEREKASPSLSPKVELMASEPFQNWVGSLISDTLTIHTLLVGATGAGKTTIAKLLLYGRTAFGHRVVVIDPDAAKDTWGDLEVRGAGDDYSSIDQVLQFFIDEVKKRGKERSQLLEIEAQFPRVTIVVDEVPSLQSNCPHWPIFFEQLGSRGRKRGLHLILLTQSNRVASLGIEGKGDLRENFTIVNLDHRKLVRPNQVEVSVQLYLNEIIPLLGQVQFEESDRFGMDLSPYQGEDSTHYSIDGEGEDTESHQNSGNRIVNSGDRIESNSDLREAIITLKDEGWTYARLQKLFKVGPNTISDILKREELT